jgi:predicted GNAT family acetyltransferase
MTEKTGGLFGAWMRRNALRRFHKIRPYLVGQALLDVGAAEGWIGEAAAEIGGMEVDLVDVVDLNRTGLPHQVCDERHLPFGNKSRDTVTVLLTLHHCKDPEAVLAEALRVARRRIIVAESVYHTRPGRALLGLMDGGFNGPRSDGAMAPALHFKTVGEWREIFREHGLSLAKEAWLSRGLHWQRLFVLDVDGVRHDAARGRFETPSGACLDYRLDVDGALVITHTFVPENQRGRGLARRLMEAAIDHAKIKKHPIRATCSYAAVYLREKLF